MHRVAEFPRLPVAPKLKAHNNAWKTVGIWSRPMNWQAFNMMFSGGLGAGAAMVIFLVVAQVVVELRDLIHEWLYRKRD